MLVLEDDLVSDYRIFNILLDKKNTQERLKILSSNLNCDFFLWYW